MTLYTLQRSADLGPSTPSQTVGQQVRLVQHTSCHEPVQQRLELAATRLRRLNTTANPSEREIFLRIEWLVHHVAVQRFAVWVVPDERRQGMCTHVLGKQRGENMVWLNSSFGRSSGNGSRTTQTTRGHTYQTALSLNRTCPVYP